MAEGYVLENAGLPERVMADCQAVFHRPLEEEITSAATDARFCGLYQNTPGIVYGSDLGTVARVSTRRVDLDVRSVTETMALFIADRCGIERAEGARP